MSAVMDLRPTLKFSSRCRGEIRNGWKRSWYPSADGRYRVVHHHCLLGRRTGRPKDTYSDYWTAESGRVDGGWDVISKHRGRRGAEASCRRHHRDRWGR